ncbi:hypothetical protein M3D75_02975 [Microbacterium enclense]|uniref:hypothetical protein n=1 Tax=Microbacterium enclense TaxID=993073 RepID=UPI0021A8F57D|nr:hypothetical protein [Microbacterium enclense]MCT2085070.1 hypothetical protein [Microbacterium enclense]
MTTLEDQKALIQRHLPAVLHGDVDDSGEAVREILEGSAEAERFMWTASFFATIAATDLRTRFAVQIAFSTPGKGFFAFLPVGDGHPDPEAANAAMRIVIAWANDQTKDTATMVRTLWEDTLSDTDAEAKTRHAATVLMCLAQLARRAHHAVCAGGHR